MRIAELSRHGGVPVATVKYYLREGLLPPGEATARNQADYGEEHVRRLRLVRALLEVGGLSLASVRAVLAAVDDQETPLHEAVGRAHRALGPPVGEAATDDVRRARDEVTAFLAARGWRVGPQSPARHALADALVALRRLGRDVGVEVFAPYAALADSLAAGEIDYIGDGEGGTRADLVEQVVVGTVVFEAALVALRRLAQEHHSAVRWVPAAADEQARVAPARGVSPHPSPVPRSG